MIRGREIINDHQAIGCGQPHKAVAEIVLVVIGVIGAQRAVASDEVDIAEGIRSGPSAPLPDRSFSSIRCRVIGSHLLQRLCVIPQQPTVVRTIIPVRTVAEIYHTVEQQQARPIQFAQRVERHLPSTVVPYAVPRYDGLDLNRTAELFRPGRQVESVQTMHVLSASGRLLGLGLNEKRTGCGVDDGRACDPDLRHEVAFFSGVRRGHGGHARSRVDETHLPERRGVRTGIVIGVEGIDTVMLRGDKGHVMRPFSRNGDVRHIKRLRINVAIDSVRKQLAERVCVNVGQVQGRLICVLARPCDIVTVGQHRYLAHS